MKKELHNLPTRNDGNLDWQRIKYQDPKNWKDPAPSNDEVGMQFLFDDDSDEDQGPLIEDLGDFATMVHADSVRQMRKVFDDIYEKHRGDDVYWED